ncbi:MAG: RluA family pseudouridine synthase, partial [Lachnospiraceae bacterium]|nr:RluA family pseudouridine synthase [Lachnospiraceae bacterium]
HPAAGHFEHTLVNALMYHCGDSLSGINGVMRPGIVHRIDMNTTGSIIACKNDNAHIKIAAQLKEHSINRTYIAIVCGNIGEDELTINAPLGRSSKDRKKMAVVQGGKNAITHVFVRQRFGAYTLVECKLETGRTHQIRVHMASINHPILGDDIYGKASNRFKTDGQALHAYKLGFVHPTSGEYIETVAPIPDYMNRILVELKA